MFAAVIATNTINHAAPINQGAGVRFTAGSPESLVFGATVEQFAIGSTITGVQHARPVAPTGGFTDPNRGTPTPASSRPGRRPRPTPMYNRVSVYGLDVNGGLPFAFLGQKKGAITVQGAYTVSAEGANNGFNNVGNKPRYQSHEELAGFNLGKLGVQAGYQFVGPYFSAPGYWGKIGAWTNPTNVKGPVYFLKYPITPKLALNADYEQYRAAYGTNDNGTPVVSPMQGRDHVNRYQVGLGYGLSSTYAVDLGYERVSMICATATATLAELPASRLRSLHDHRRRPRLQQERLVQAAVPDRSLQRSRTPASATNGTAPDGQQLLRQHRRGPVLAEVLTRSFWNVEGPRTEWCGGFFCPPPCSLARSSLRSQGPPEREDWRGGSSYAGLTATPAAGGPRTEVGF